MNCSNCTTEMEHGYMLQLGLSGVIRVVKDKDGLSPGKATAAVCPNCGKLEIFVDYKSIK